MKIYGDVVLFDISKETKHFSYSVLTVDYINSNGVYGGQSPWEVARYIDGTHGVSTKGWKNYVGISGMTKYATVEQLADMGVTLTTVPGSYVADAIGAEYVNVE